MTLTSVLCSRAGYSDKLDADHLVGLLELPSEPPQPKPRSLSFSAFKRRLNNALEVMLPRGSTATPLVHEMLILNSAVLSCRAKGNPTTPCPSAPDPVLQWLSEVQLPPFLEAPPSALVVSGAPSAGFAFSLTPPTAAATESSCCCATPEAVSDYPHHNSSSLPKSPSMGPNRSLPTLMRAVLSKALLH